MSQSNGKATLIRHRMLELLSDGAKHTRTELHSCLNDDLASLAAIQGHIVLLRKEVAEKGLLIVCEQGNGPIGYRLVRKITKYD